MKLSKTTVNFAERRGIFFDYVEGDDADGIDRVWFFFDEEGCEPDLSYIMNQDGTFTYYHTLTLPQHIKEELPATIKNEKHFREVVDFLSNHI